MSIPVRLFISGGPDQDAARELLGQGLAKYPVNVGWVIKRTPDVDSVAECHVFVMLLGHDIWAPVGLELWWALRTEKPILAYSQRGARTPAGQVFWQQNAVLNWTRYSDVTTLRRLVMAGLNRFLLTHADRYGLGPLEIDRLHQYQAALRKALRKQGRDLSGAAETEVAGAGGGGVILAPGKDHPPGAVLMEED
jgi:hypothetical protein